MRSFGGPQPRDYAWGRNALNCLCRSGQGCHSYLERHTEPARKLLAAGADPYRCDNGADMHRPDCQGRTPIQQAALAGNWCLLSMMGGVSIIVDKRRKNR